VEINGEACVRWGKCAHLCGLDVLDIACDSSQEVFIITRIIWVKLLIKQLCRSFVCKAFLMSATPIASVLSVCLSVMRVARVQAFISTKLIIARKCCWQFIMYCGWQAAHVTRLPARRSAPILFFVWWLRQKRTNLHNFYRQNPAKRQTASIKFTHGPKIFFFAPQGRLVAPIHVNFGRTDGHVGPLGCATF